MQSGVGRSGMGEELRTSVELGQLRDTDLGSKGGREIGALSSASKEMN